jgi:hypothetical protein
MFFASVFAVYFSGCVVINFSDSNAVAGKGDLEKYELRVGGYSGIKTKGSFAVRYRAAYSDTVTLEIQPNLREYFTAEVISGDLVVGTKRRISVTPGKTPVLTVSTPVLNRLNIEGACTFTAYDTIKADSFTLKVSGAGDGKAELDVDNLFVEVSGAGDFGFSGRADNAGFNLSGTGDLEALSLQTQTANIRISGAGTVAINCEKDLHVDASGTGTVKYKGSPALDINRSGMISIKKLD